MGKPGFAISKIIPQYCGKGTRGSETSQYPEEKKTIPTYRRGYSLSSGERKGKSLKSFVLYFCLAQAVVVR